MVDANLDLSCNVDALRPRFSHAAHLIMWANFSAGLRKPTMHTLSIDRHIDSTGTQNYQNTDSRMQEQGGRNEWLRKVGIWSKGI